MNPLGQTFWLETRSWSASLPRLGVLSRFRHRTPRIRRVWRGRDALPSDPHQSTINGRVRCTAFDGRCVPARPALHVSTRLLHSPPSFLVRLWLPTPLHERAFRTTLHLLWTCCAGCAGTHRRSKALKPTLPSGNLSADRPGARPYQGWAFYRATGIARLGHGACGVVGTRSRAIRVSTTDGRVRCTASDGRCVPARPALHVSTRLLHSPPSFPVRLWLPTPLHERGLQNYFAPSADVLRRTRRNA